MGEWCMYKFLLKHDITHAFLSMQLFCFLVAAFKFVEVWSQSSDVDLVGRSFSIMIFVSWSRWVVQVCYTPYSHSHNWWRLDGCLRNIVKTTKPTKKNDCYYNQKWVQKKVRSELIEEQEREVSPCLLFSSIVSCLASLWALLSGWAIRGCDWSGLERYERYECGWVRGGFWLCVCIVVLLCYRVVHRCCVVVLLCCCVVVLLCVVVVLLCCCVVVLLCVVVVLCCVVGFFVGNKYRVVLIALIVYLNRTKSIVHRVATHQPIN